MSYFGSGTGPDLFPQAEILKHKESGSVSRSSYKKKMCSSSQWRRSEVITTTGMKIIESEGRLYNQYGGHVSCQ